MNYIGKIDRYLDSLKVGKSAVVDSWFMMSSPMPILAVVTTYLFFLKIGTRMMKNRPALQLTNIVSYYNAGQVALATMLCIKVLKLKDMFKDGIIYAGCRYPSTTQNPMLLDLGWWYFFAKFTELLDTVFFVLRKKNKQVTFLHVYHHVVMALYGWSYLKFAAGGEGTVLAFLNSAVHIVMYSYYFLSGLGPKFQKYLWWKKYVTKMQLTQFVLMLVYCALTHFSPKCQYAAGFTYFISFNIIVFLLLFVNFYSKSYKRPKDNLKQNENILQNGHCTINGKTHEGNGINTEISTNGTKVPYEMDKIEDIKNGNGLIRRSLKESIYGPDFNFRNIEK